MKKKLFAMILCLVMILSSVSILSEVSFAEGVKPFTVTKRPVGSTEDGELVGNYDTFYEAVGNCKQEDLTNEYVITMNSDYTIPETEAMWGKNNVNMIWRSKEGKQYTLKRSNKDLVTLFEEATLRIENVILDGNNNAKGIGVMSGTLTLGKGSIVQNFTEVQGFDGPAIYLTGSATLNIEEGAIIKDNRSDHQGGAIGANDETTTININGGTFINNFSSKYGGAIATWGTLNVNGGTFEKNKSPYGGAIAAFKKATPTISNATFKENTADRQGGAIMSWSELSIENSNFEKNKSTWGGAIFASKKLTLNHSIFKNNEVTSAGGALYLQGGADINKTNFIENTAARNGGAIYITKGDSNITGCEFTKNGIQAIFINHENNGTTTISDTTFTENYSTSFGGGIYLGLNSKLDITKSTFTKNEAPYGAGIASAGKGDVDTTLTNIKVDSSIFTDNLALMGAGIYTAFPTEINNCNFTKNKADVHQQDDQKNPHSSGVGGAVEVIDNKTLIKASTFEENFAYGSGGALGISGVVRDESKNIASIKPNISVEISEGTKFVGNTCGIGQGGAIFTIPYLYDIEGYQTNVPIETLKEKAYSNLTTTADTVFKDNVALSGFVNPPVDYTKYTNLEFDRNSFTDVLPGKDVAKSLLNNYDVNFKNEKVTAYFDPNGGEFVNEANPKDIKVIKKDKVKENGEDKGAEFTILQAPKRDGYKFLGWKGTSLIPQVKLNEFNEEVRNEILKFERMYDPGETVTLKSNFIFTAQWEKASAPTTHILTLDENYAHGKITDYDVMKGEAIDPYLYTPRRRGYVFKGWSYNRDFLDEVRKGDIVYGDTVLYAIWKKDKAKDEAAELEEIKGQEHKAYIFGYPDGTVRPNGEITRAEAAAMLARLLEIESIGSADKPSFPDTPSAWYNKAINAVVQRGIMKGYPDGTFKPNDAITRAEFTQMISTIDNKPYGTAPFADVVGHWAERPIGSEYQAGRILGYPDGTFRPDAHITRCEAAVILNKIFERNFDNMSLLKCKTHK